MWGGGRWTGPGGTSLGLASSLSRVTSADAPVPSGTVWACSRMLPGRGVLPAVSTHYKLSSIIYGDLEEPPACPEQPCSHALQKAACGVPQRAHACPHLG